MKSKKRLSDLATIRFGINVKSIPGGGVPCLQGKDIDQYGNFDNSTLMNVPEYLCSDKDWLKPSEVLFAAKGTRNYAVVWNQTGMNTVASSTFFVIQGDNKEIIPEYLAWYLMSAKARRHFEQHMKKSTVPTISKKVLDKLEIEIPPIKKQNNIVSIYNLWIREQQLIKRTQELKHKLVFSDRLI